MAPWAVFGLAVVVSVAGVPSPTAWARLYFTVFLLGGLLAAARLAGARAQLAAAAVGLVLVVGERTIPRPLARPPSSQWTVPLTHPDQVVQHVMDLPIGEPAWSRLWQRAAGAAVYVCARGPLAEADGLELSVNGEIVAAITDAQAVGARPQPTSIGFYRLPVSRRLLERQRPATFVLRRRLGTAERAVEICGTFTYRPTAGLESSTLYDGVRWSSPGTTDRGRFLIELRVEDGQQRPLAALY